MIRKFCITLVAMLLLAVFTMSVSATEIPDWDTVDWETYEWEGTDGTEERASLENWLSEEASMEELFEVTRNCRSASFYALDEILNQRFIATPEKFLIALAKEDASWQKQILQNLFTEAVKLDHQATIRAIEDMHLSKEKNPEAVTLLMQLIEIGEKKLAEQGMAVTITIPKTGDPVMLAVTALLLSGTGFALLFKKKVIEK